MDPEYLAIPHGFSILDLMRFVLLMGLIISTIDIGTFLLNDYYSSLGPSSSILGVEKFQCHWFVQGILSQTLVIYVTRTAKIPFFQGHPSTVIVASTLLASVVGFAIPYVPPFAKALKLVRPAGDFIGILVACLVLYTIVMQLAKIVYIRIWKRWL
ncbi:hypothetical protein IFR05_004030 [Cadophora sp. M221]|nr:hypothetical protein IFR05_004030 [Cadophora sp. M221]